MIAAAGVLAAGGGSVRAGSRGEGPAGSLLLVEESHAVPLVTVVVAARGGSAGDPRGREGLANLAAELARRGAAKKPRAALDAALDAIGATLEVHTDPDSVRFEGQVLSRHLDAFLGLLADVVLRPDFAADELARTKRDILAGLDDLRTDDRSLCGRFFRRNAYGEQHPYGHDPEGTRAGVEDAKRDEAAAHFRAAFVGKNLIFAAAGDVTAAAFASKIERAFAGLEQGRPRPVEIPPVAAPKGWRIQLVDKPDRQQTQIMIGHPTLRPADPDYLPLSLALATFGGHAMSATMMHEIRVMRGLAYGAYMDLEAARGPSLVQGWVFSAADKTVDTLRFLLHLYVDLMDKGVSEERLKFFQGFLGGAYASGIDSPERRLHAKLAAEIVGLPADFVDTYPDKIKALTAAEVSAAVKKFVKARDLAITLVASADTMMKLLTESRPGKPGIKPGAIDVVKFDDPKY